MSLTKFPYRQHLAANLNTNVFSLFCNLQQMGERDKSWQKTFDPNQRWHSLMKINIDAHWQKSTFAIHARPARRRLRSRLVSQWKLMEPKVKEIDTKVAGVNFLAADNQVLEALVRSVLFRLFHQLETTNTFCPSGGGVRIHKRRDCQGVLSPRRRPPSCPQVRSWWGQGGLLWRPGDHCES